MLPPRALGLAFFSQTLQNRMKIRGHLTKTQASEHGDRGLRNSAPDTDLTDKTAFFLSDFSHEIHFDPESLFWMIREFWSWRTSEVSVVRG